MNIAQIYLFFLPFYLVLPRFASNGSSDYFDTENLKKKVESDRPRALGPRERAKSSPTQRTSRETKKKPTNKMKLDDREARKKGRR